MPSPSLISCMQVDNHDDGAGTMEAVYFGNCNYWGYGAGNGPWVMADLENGLWAGDVRYNSMNNPMTSEYVTAMVKGGINGFGIKAGDATQGPLSYQYLGARPAGYQPMKKQGSIILGIGGDNSNSAIGTFYEGVMTSGYSSDVSARPRPRPRPCRHLPLSPSLYLTCSSSYHSVCFARNLQAVDNAVQANIIAAGYGQ
jgi:hypothetical protein